MKTKEEVVQEMQQVVEQMRLDDIEENPDCENEFFTCDACGGTKSLAGSVQYGHYRLCNDCVLFAEVGFELGQIKDIEELIAAMDDKRLEADCEFLKQEEKSKDSFEMKDFFKCTFLSIYLRCKEKEKYQKKEKTRHSFLRSYER